MAHGTKLLARHDNARFTAQSPPRQGLATILKA